MIISYITGNLWLLYSIIEKRYPDFDLFANSDEMIFEHYDGDQSYTFNGLGTQVRNNFYDANSFELKDNYFS